MMPEPLNLAARAPGFGQRRVSCQQELADSRQRVRKTRVCAPAMFVFVRAATHRRAPGNFAHLLSA
jgi:hypothetical protein